MADGGVIDPAERETQALKPRSRHLGLPQWFPRFCATDASLELNGAVSQKRGNHRDELGGGVGIRASPNCATWHFSL